MSASCNRGSNCSLTQAMDGRIVRCSCQSAATSEIVKLLWSRVSTHVRCAIASARSLPLPLPLTFRNETEQGRARQCRSESKRAWTEECDHGWWVTWSYQRQIQRSIRYVDIRRFKRFESRFTSFARNVEQVLKSTACSGRLSFLSSPGREMICNWCWWAAGWRLDETHCSGVVSLHAAPRVQ